MNTKPELLDVVELRDARAGHKAGTTGAVVEIVDGDALVEIVDETGSTSEIVQIPLEALRVKASERSRTPLSLKPHVR